MVDTRGSRTDLHTMQRAIFLGFLEKDRQPLGSKDKEVRGEGATLPQTPLRDSNLGQVLVALNSVCDGCDAVHHQLNPIRIKTQLQHQILQKRPFNTIEGLAHVQFHSSQTISATLAQAHKVSCFIGKQDIVGDKPPSHKGALTLRNNIIQHLLETASDRFGNDFENQIAKTDRPHVLDAHRVQNLRNQHYHSLVPTSRNRATI